MKRALQTVLIFLFLVVGGISGPAQEEARVVAPPPAVSEFYAKPQTGRDPYQVVMVDGPLTAAAEDMRELRRWMDQHRENSTQKERACQTILLAMMEATRDRNFTAAEEFARKVQMTQCDPRTNAFTHFYLGTIFEEKREFGEALKVLLVARESFAQVESHRYRFYCDATLGRCYYYLGAFKEALFYLSEVLKAYPGDFPHRFLAAISAGRLGFREEGIRHLKHILDNIPPVQRNLPLFKETLYTISVAYFQGGNFDHARIYCLQGLKLEPQSQRFTALLAQIDAVSRENVRVRQRRKLFGVF